MHDPIVADGNLDEATDAVGAKVTAAIRGWCLYRERLVLILE